MEREQDDSTPPTGGVRGIVVGDFVRRLVARTLAQQLGPAVESATTPFQFALSTKAGSECIAHVAQALSVDGIGAFDLVSRGAMMSGLLEVEGGASALSFVRQFYGSPSTYLWDDDDGVTHEIAQGESGEHGDALMPLLFSLGLHRSLSGSRRQRFVERASARHGFGSAGRAGQPSIGDCGGRPAIVPRSAACN